MRLLVILLVVLAAQAAAAAPTRPNVVIFLADDLGWADVGFRGGPIDTPSIDRLAREGMELHRFYTTPICSPTRAALMTGPRPDASRCRVLGHHAVDEPRHSSRTSTSCPQSFQAAGYQTAMVGKWHLGHAQETYHPNRRGFDHFYGHLHTEVGYFPPFANQGGKDFQRNGESPRRRGLRDVPARATRRRATSADARRSGPSSSTCPSSRRTRRSMRPTT